METIVKLSFTYIRNVIVSEVKLFGKLPEEINDLTGLGVDLGITEWELSHIFYMINLKYNIRFAIENIIGFKN